MVIKILSILRGIHNYFKCKGSIFLFFICYNIIFFVI